MHGVMKVLSVGPFGTFFEKLLQLYVYVFVKPFPFSSLYITIDLVESIPTASVSSKTFRLVSDCEGSKFCTFGTFFEELPTSCFFVLVKPLPFSTFLNDISRRGHSNEPFFEKK